MVMLALGAALFVVPVSVFLLCMFFFFSSRRRHTRSLRDWSSDVCSSDLSAVDQDIHLHCAGGDNRRGHQCEHGTDAFVAPMKIGAVFVTDAPEGWNLRGDRKSVV